MVIKVKTESQITGSGEHVVTEEGLRAQGLDVTIYEPRADLALLVGYIEGLELDDTTDVPAAAARLAEHYELNEV